MAELAAAGILAAGSYGARRLFNYQKKMGYGNSTITHTLPVTKTDANTAQIYRLRRMVLASRKQVSNWPDQITPNFGPVSVTGIGYNLTNRFVTSTGAGAYNDIVLGDKFENIKSQMRFDISTSLNRVRVIVYWAKKAGTSLTFSDFSTTADPTAFTVVYDRTFSPQGASSTLCNNVHSAMLYHRGKITNYNESAATIESGELHIRFIAENGTAASHSLVFGHRMFVRSK